MQMATQSTSNDITRKLVAVRQRIAVAAQRAQRAPEEITLVAVSKTKPFAAIQTAYAAGQRDFGENRLEELWEKAEQAQQLGLHDIRWHMIGTIQSRKTAQAVGPITLIHSVDRLKIAQHLSRDAMAAHCVLSILLEVNVSGESSKHGFSPEELLQLAPEVAKLPSIRLQGLMTMAPLVEAAEAARPVFRALRQLRDQLTAAGVGEPTADHPLQLSMGMTNDFEVAIEEGATIVRVGSAIFGEREHG
ncbi:YggS family pyridoxal phosphate-dependent enzyme [soil metagenome]